MVLVLKKNLKKERTFKIITARASTNALPFSVIFQYSLGSLDIHKG